MSPPRDLHALRADQAFWRASRAWDSSVACSFQTYVRKSSAASGRVDLQSRAPYLGAGLEGNCQLHGSHNKEYDSSVARESRRMLLYHKSCAGATPSHTAATHQTHT
jgi:hypothetical protein